MTTYTMNREDVKAIDLKDIKCDKEDNNYCGMLSESLLTSTIILAKIRGENITEFARRFGIRSVEDTIQLLYYWSESEMCKI